MGFILGIVATIAGLIILGVVGYVAWRMAKGHTKLEQSRTELKHKHYWSPWTEHEAALYDGSELVRFAPGQLRTCLDPDCSKEDIRLVGGQTTSGDNDAES